MVATNSGVRSRLDAGISLRITGLIVAAVVAYWPASRALWSYWLDHPFFGGHGILLALVSCGLLYRARRRVESASVRGTQRMLLPLVACSVGFVMLSGAQAQSAQMLLLPLLILLAVWAAFGAVVTQLVAIPVGLLYFAMPVWDWFAVPLQSLTLEVVRLVAPLLGLPAAIEGTRVYLQGGATFDVTIWCSGLGLLVQGLAVATLVGELEQAPLIRRLWLLATMAVLALVTNWIRVLTIIQVGYTTGMRHVLVTRYHVEFGFVLYALALLLFLWIALRTRPSRAEVLVVARPPAREPAQYQAALLALVAVPLLYAATVFLR